MKYLLLGAKSVRRIGIGAFACLVMGCVMLELALIMTRNISAEMQNPCELTAYAADISDGDITELSAMDGVVSATAVIEYMGTLSVGDYRQDITVYGISPSYISGFITDGGAFPEQSLMPYIVLNKKAMTGFTDARNKPVYSDSINWREQLSDMSGRAVSICGIADDGKPMPCGYTNIASLKNVILENGGAPAYSFVWLRLSGLEYEEQAIRHLTSIGFDAASNTVELRAKLKNEASIAKCIFAGSVTALFAAAVIVFNKSKADYYIKNAEYKTLIYFGADRMDITLIYISRIFVFVIIAIAVSLVIAVFVKQLWLK